MNKPWNVWFGIRFRFHPLFSILLLLSAVTGYFIEMLTLFGIIFIHELGHVVAASAFGWRIREIQLLPFGGVAEVEEQSDVPAWQDVVVALAGPLQNVWMMAVAAAMTRLGWLPEAWGAYFMQANLLLALFNLLPVLPLDGGKVMQAVLGLWMPYQQTIRFAAWISLGFSALIVFASAQRVLQGENGIELNWLAIGGFLLYSNVYDLKGLPYRTMRFLVNRPLRQALKLRRGTMARPIVASGRRSVTEVVRLFMRDRYHLVYLTDERGMIRYVVPEQALLDCYFDKSRRERPLSELFLP